MCECNLDRTCHLINAQADKGPLFSTVQWQQQMCSTVRKEYLQLPQPTFTWGIYINVDKAKDKKTPPEL